MSFESEGETHKVMVHIKNVNNMKEAVQAPCFLGIRCAHNTDVHRTIASLAPFSKEGKANDQQAFNKTGRAKNVWL